MLQCIYLLSSYTLLAVTEAAKLLCCIFVILCVPVPRVGLSTKMKTFLSGYFYAFLLTLTIETLSFHSASFINENYFNYFCIS